MIIQTQYGTGEWQQVNAAAVIVDMWVANAAATGKITVKAARDALAAGQVLRVKAEWHDRIRAQPAQ